MPQTFAGQRITAGLLSEDYATGDTSTTTVTAATSTLLSKSFTIPASDAAAGTVYRLTAWGNGTWGSTRQSLAFNLEFAGSAIGLNPTVDFSVFSASAVFRWKAELILECLSTGSSGTWSGNIDGCLTQTANNIIPGTAANNSVPFNGGTGSNVTQDTTVANAFALFVSWASTTGAPTITCHGTLFERCGG